MVGVGTPCFNGGARVCWTRVIGLGIYRIETFALDISGQDDGLVLAARGNVHVNPAAEGFLVTGFDFGMTDEPQKCDGYRRGGRWKTVAKRI